MSADYVSVSKQITLSEKHQGANLLVKVSALFYPDEDRITNPSASIETENPDHEDGFYEIEFDGDPRLLGVGDNLPPSLFVAYERQIEAAAKEAAEATHI